MCERYFHSKAYRPEKTTIRNWQTFLKCLHTCPLTLSHPCTSRNIWIFAVNSPRCEQIERRLYLSHIFKKAREWGYTTLQNPCQDVKGFKETGHSRYITDKEFEQVKAQAHFTVIDAMDLALLTGQRPADVLKLKRTDIRDGALWIVQNKTRQRLGVEVTGELAAVIARISERPRRAISAWLIQDENGQPLTQGVLRSRFDKARTAAEVDFQFRDIRGKAATDTGNLAHSQKLLGHKNREMTEHYVKARIGERVKPL